MQFLASLIFLIYLRLVNAHGGHEHDGPATGETVQEYAQRHMASEHHIDSFDLGSFFQLHDLNRDGIWDREEIEAIYGVHHVYSQKKSKDEVEHQKKADHISKTVLSLLDKDKDGKVTLAEFAQVGVAGLPNFEDLGAEGHHYDIESEFFLHHEEQFHSTPETQTDDAYVHPEDLEHFAHHEHIEHEEAEREAKFQGITVEEALAQHEPHEHEEGEQPVDAGSDGAQVVLEHDNKAPSSSSPSIPKITRGIPAEKLDPAERFKDARPEGEWGLGDEGYKPPKSPSDRIRKNVPYKERMQYKFRRTWGDF